MLKSILIAFVICLKCCDIRCNVKVGPDPWDIVKNTGGVDYSDSSIPPDLRPIKQKPQVNNGEISIAEWFYKRMIAIVLNGGQVKTNEEGEVDIMLHMKFNAQKWQALHDFIKYNDTFKDDMFRRSLGCIEEAIQKPSIIHEVTIAWGTHLQMLFVEYKMYITWIFGICAALGIIIWLWRHTSHKHFLITLFVLLYLYEVIISYKEAEQQEYERFAAVLNKCSWYFWKNTCDVPMADPLIFMKHMNPLKIGIRMFATLITEPMLALTVPVNTMITGITDELWYPFNIILRTFLILCINFLLICLLVMITFNFLLNIPFNLSIGLGLVNIGLKQRQRNLNVNTINNENQNENRRNLNYLSDVKEIKSQHRRPIERQQQKQLLSSNNFHKIKRSSSAGR